MDGCGRVSLICSWVTGQDMVMLERHVATGVPLGFLGAVLGQPLKRMALSVLRLQYQGPVWVAHYWHITGLSGIAVR
jgi:hypothetical protein